MPWIFILGAVPLAVAAWTDGRRREIPNWVSAALLLCALANVATGGVTLLQMLEGVALAGTPLLLCALWRDSIGGGDVKLCAAVGGLIGAVPTLFATAIALSVMLVCTAAARKLTLPFAPFFFPVYGIIVITEMIKC